MNSRHNISLGKPYSRSRCEADGIPQTADALAKQFRLHLHRGISYLVGTEDTKTLNGLISLAIEP